MTTADGAGIETVLMLTSDYSVTGVGDAAGGSVILTAPLATGLQLVITRDVPATQETDLENQGAFFAQTIEDSLDKLTMLVQQGEEVDSRTVTLSVTSDGVSTSLPGVVANTLLGWNADGSALENKAPNDGTVLPALLGSLTTAEITQLLNIDTATISAAQWGFLGGLGAAPLEPNAPATVTDLTATQQFVASGALTPPQITANQNDYNPTGLAEAFRLRLATNGALALTGLQGGAEGRFLLVENVGANSLTLSHESASSAAANRFAFAGGNDLTLSPERSALLIYDGVSSRWQRVDDADAGEGVADAWGVLQGTGTISLLNSFGMAAPTDNGIGDYTFNMSSAFVDGNFVVTYSTRFDQDVFAASGIGARQVREEARSTTTARMGCGFSNESGPGGHLDFDILSIACHGT
ncbi:MAG: hypothetical protein ACTS10_10940 [Kiloniellales bacterium]